MYDENHYGKCHILSYSKAIAALEASQSNMIAVYNIHICFRKESMSEYNNTYIIPNSRRIYKRNTTLALQVDHEYNKDLNKFAQCAYYIH